MKKEVNIWWLVVIGLAFDIFGRVRGDLAGATVGTFGDILILIGLVLGIIKAVKSKKSQKKSVAKTPDRKEVYSPSRIAEKTQVTS